MTAEPRTEAGKFMGRFVRDIGRAYGIKVVGSEVDKAIAAIEAEAALPVPALDAYIERLRAAIKGISLPPGPDFAWVDGHRPFIKAALDAIEEAREANHDR